MTNENEISAEQAENNDVDDVEYVDNDQPNNTIRHHRVEYSGPLPPAGEMERYAQIDPEFANRIMAMAEAEARHRHETEKSVIEHQSNDIKRGQMYALAIGLAGFTFSAYALYLDRAWVATFFGGGTLVLLVTAFIRGRKD